MTSEGDHALCKRGSPDVPITGGVARVSYHKNRELNRKGPLLPKGPPSFTPVVALIEVLGRTQSETPPHCLHTGQSDRLDLTSWVLREGTCPNPIDPGVPSPSPSSSVQKENVSLPLSPVTEGCVSPERPRRLESST